MNYYNDIDPKCCAWTQELINAGLIPPGDVVCKSILDIKPHELEKYTQCHFFCGINGWSHALRLAGWPDDRPVWTGSPPCQPFSCAGKQAGASDDRNLWTPFVRLVRECRPECIFGEQVEAAIRVGWLDRVFADLEEMSYATGSVILGAHSAGAPHIRQRIYWCAVRMADCGSGGRFRQDAAKSGGDGTHDGILGGNGDDGRLADARCPEHERQRRCREAHGATGTAEGEAQQREWSWTANSDCCAVSRMADADGAKRELRELRLFSNGRSGDGIEEQSERAKSGLADASGGQRQQLDGAQGHGLQRPADDGAGGGMGHADEPGPQGRREHRKRAGELPSRENVPSNFWSGSRWHACRDGKARRVPASCGFQFVAPGIPDLMAALRDAGCHEAEIRQACDLFPLASEKITGRVMLLRGAGNAISPPVAAEFIKAVMDCLDGCNPPRIS